MANLPDIIDGGIFPVPFTAGTRMTNTNMYSGSILNNIPAVYFLLEENMRSEDIEYWYNFAMEHYSSPYILQVFGRSTCMVNQNATSILFTEVVNVTFEDWAENNVLLETPQRLSPPFISILLDILRGMIFFHCVLNRPHGEIRANNIYIVGGRAKFANIVDNRNTRGISYEEDINRFCNMVRALFADMEIPLELGQFCQTMRKHKKDQRFLCNSVNHPILLTPAERAEMRHSAYSLAMDNDDQFRNSMKMFFAFAFNDASKRFPSIQGQFWTHNVIEPEFYHVLCYQNQPTGEPKPTYRDDAWGFLRFSRNAGEHVRHSGYPHLSDENKDRILTSYLPGFLPIVYEFFTDNNVFPRPLPIIE